MAFLGVLAGDELAQRGAKARMRAVIDQQLGALVGRLASQVGEAVLGDDDVRVVLGVVKVDILCEDVMSIR